MSPIAQAAAGGLARGPLAALLAGSLGILAVALVAVVAWRWKTRVAWRWFGAGALAWAIGFGVKLAFSQLFDGAVLYGLHRSLAPSGFIAAGAVYAGAQAAACEMGAALALAAVFRAALRDPSRAVAIGIGAGAAETLLAGINWLIAAGMVMRSSAPADAVPPELAMALSIPLAAAFLPIERLLTLACHVGGRVLVIYGLVGRLATVTLAGFALFGLVYGSLGAYQLSSPGPAPSLSPWWLELAILPLALLSLAATRWCVRYWPTQPPA